MITKEILTDTIKKAKCKLAKKTVKYYTNLAVGQSSKKAFEELRMLKFYIKILEAFKIVGETDPCNCCIEGEYTFLADADIPESEVRIQFSKDNQGYFTYNGVGYTFTYGYDANNEEIIFKQGDIQFTFNGAIFDENCNIIHEGNFPIEIAETDVIQTPNPLLGGTIVLFDGELNPINVFNYPSDITGDYEAIANAWNNEFGNEGWLLSFVEGRLRMSSPYDDTNYFGYSFDFTQSEGEYTDAISLFIEPFVSPFKTTTTPAETNQVIPTTQFSGVIAQTNEFEIPDSFLTVDETIITVYYLGNPITHKDAPITFSEFVTYFNESNTQGFVMEIGPSGGNNVIIKAPTASDSYNGEAISFDNTVDIIFGTFAGGVNITPGNITVTDETLGVIYFQNSVGFVTIQDFVDDFNLNNIGGFSAVTDGIVLSNTRVKYTAPSSTGFTYNGTTLVYNFFGTGYTDTSFWNSGEDTTIGRVNVSLLTPLDVFSATLYSDTELVNYSSLSQIADAFNNSTTNMGFTCQVVGDDLQFTSPENTGSFYNDWQIEFTYIYESSEYLDIELRRPFLDGEDPTPTTYNAIFASTANTSTLVNDNPCTPTPNEEVCLTNEQIEKIIDKVNSL